jgi:hypothetical protein
MSARAWADHQGGPAVRGSSTTLPVPASSGAKRTCAAGWRAGCVQHIHGRALALMLTCCPPPPPPYGAQEYERRRLRGRLDQLHVRRTHIVREMAATEASYLADLHTTLDVRSGPVPSHPARACVTLVPGCSWAL